MNHPRTPQDPPEACRKTVGDWLELSCEWKIPVYQRHYQWKSGNENESGPIDLFWKTVEEQTIARLEGGEQPNQHYLGAVLVKNTTSPNTTDGTLFYDVVDGQQRLTTIQIALLAIIPVAKKCDCGDEIKEKLKKYIFRNNGNLRLLPTNFDALQFHGVVMNVYKSIPLIGDVSQRYESNAKKSIIYSAFEFFTQKHQEMVDRYPQKKDVIHGIMDSLLKGFDLVRIVLRYDDDAQRIFESLNNYAMPLTTFDLIRNNVFDRAGKNKNEPGMDVRLFNEQDKWQRLEEPYWWDEYADKVSKSKHIDAYIPRMLVAQMKKDVQFNRNDIFMAYQEFARTFHPRIDDEIKALIDYIDIYQHLDLYVPGSPQNGPYGINFGVFCHQIWKSRDFYPVIFVIARSDLDKNHKQRMIDLLESYVVRRSVCALPHDNYNLYVANICQELGNEPNYEKLRNFLRKSDHDTYVFPDNDRMKRDCETAKFYKSAFPRYVFDRIETSMHPPHAERVTAKNDKLSIDHILPQKWHADTEWEAMLGGSDEMIAFVKVYVDTIGNLTMMSSRNNSKKSNRSFNKAKELLAKSGMIMNNELAKENEWNIEKIKSRSQKIAEKVCQIWPYEIGDSPLRR